MPPKYRRRVIAGAGRCRAMGGKLWAAALLLILVAVSVVYVDYSMASPASLRRTSSSSIGPMFEAPTLGADSRFPSIPMPSLNATLAVLITHKDEPTYIPAWIYSYPPSIIVSEEKAIKRFSTGRRRGNNVLVIKPLSDFYVYAGSVEGVEGPCTYMISLTENTVHGHMEQRIIYANCSRASIYVKPPSLGGKLPSISLKSYVKEAEAKLGELYYTYTSIPRQDEVFLSWWMKYIIGTNAPENMSLNRVVEKLLGYIETNTYYERTSFNPESPARSLLLEGKGDCFLASLALTDMLRYLGIPARPVTGYYVSAYREVSGGYEAKITARNLHMWVEIYVEGKWIQVDTTPPRRRGGGGWAAGSPTGNASSSGSEAQGGVGGQGEAPMGSGSQGSTSMGTTVGNTPTPENISTPWINGSAHINQSTLHSPPRISKSPTPRHGGESVAESWIILLVIISAVLLLVSEHMRREEEALVEAEIRSAYSPVDTLRNAWKMLASSMYRDALIEAYRAVRASLGKHVSIQPSDTAREILLDKLRSLMGTGFPYPLLEMLERVVYGSKEAGRKEVEKWLKEAEKLVYRLTGR